MHSIVLWTPKTDELQCDERKPPELRSYFYETLLLSKNKSETYTRFVDSFCSDIMFAISNRKYATLKHTSLGLGLHSLTGMENPINISDRLGHSISYDMVCRIETPQAELSQELLKTSNMLPLVPHHEGLLYVRPSTWNKLPNNLKTATSVNCFKHDMFPLYIYFSIFRYIIFPKGPQWK